MTSRSAPFHRIAILKPCCIGDCVMALPAVDSIIAANETATIDVFVGKHSRVVFEFRRRLTTRRVLDSLDFSSALQLSRRLRQGRYDTVVCLDRSRWLRLATRLSRATIGGYVRSMSPELRHESEVYLDVVRDIGIPTPYDTPWIAPSPDVERGTAELMFEMRWPVAVLHPGGARNPGATMLNKRWPATRFVELARVLKREGTTVLLSGGTSDLDVVRAVADGAGLGESAILAGKVDIGTLAGVISRAAVYVGPDTGVTHVAAAVGTPTVAIFGPTNPRRYRPLGQHVQVLAPRESWQIPDRDLRRTSGPASTIYTESISLQAVLKATRDAINCGHGMIQCDT